MIDFLRSVQVQIIPYGNSRKEGEPVFILESTGGYHEPRIKFNINKSAGSTGVTATVEITNPSEDLKRSFSGWGNVLLKNMGKKFVYVGCRYIGPNTTEIYGEENRKKIPYAFFSSGTLIKAWITKDGPEEILSLYYMESANSSKLRNVNINNFTGNLKTCLSCLVGFLGGNGWDINREGSRWIYNPDFVEIENHKMYNYTQCGIFQDVLDSLARDYCFTWWAERSGTNKKDLYFHACSDDLLLNPSKKRSRDPGIFVADNSRGNLLAVTPEVDDLGTIQTGVNILCRLDPRLKLFQTLELYSETYPACNGRYVAIEIKYAGDTHGSDWTMEIRAMKKEVEE